jgi:hypothetical protein
MFKLSEKKQHRKRALMKLTACKPNCTNDPAEKDEFGDEFIDEYTKVARKTVQKETAYVYDSEKGQMVEKHVKYEESYRANDFDEVDNAQVMQTFQQFNVPSTQRDKVSFISCFSVSFSLLESELPERRITELDQGLKV